MGLLIIILLFVAACTTTEISSDRTTETTPATLQQFLDAGCLKRGDFLECENTEFVSKFKCATSTLLVEDEGDVFGFPIIHCPAGVSQNGLSAEEKKSYFKCSGGLFVTCASYLTYKDDQFIPIKNKAEFLSLSGPIDGQEKALLLVLLAEEGSKNLVVDHLSFKGEVKREGGNYLVTVYAPDQTFGCYDTIQYESIQYEVTPAGDVVERNREVVYTKELEYTICVD